MDITCVILCLFSALSHRVGALQISIIINISGGGGGVGGWGGGVVAHMEWPRMEERVG